MLSNEMVKRVIEDTGNDGHQIWMVEKFDYLPFEFINPLFRVIESEGSGKYAIFDKDGAIVEEVMGIYSLELLWKVAKDIGADTSIAAKQMGRGFQATALTKAIEDKLKV